MNALSSIPALILLAACGGPSGERPRTPAAHAAASAARGARAHDASLPDPAASGPVQLDQLLAWAHAHAPEVRIATANLAHAEAAREAAEPLLPGNPELGGGAGPRITQDGTGLDIEASLSQSFEIAGERGLRFDVADRVDERLSAELARAHWTVHARVHAGYHGALVERERLEAAMRLLAFQERLLEIAQRRLQAGDISPLVVRLSEGEVAQARQRRIAAEQHYQAARIRLAEVAGWPATHPPEPAGTTEAPRDLPPIARLVETMLAVQPAIAAARARVEEARARAELADRETWPEPSIGASWHREGAPNEREDVIFGTLTVPIPLWQRNQGERARARADLAVAEAELESLELQLRARLARSESAVRAAAERIAVYGTEVLPSFERNLSLLERAYELGEIDVLDVSVAVERFLRAQTDALDAQADYFEALAELEETLGTDPWPDEHHGTHDHEERAEPVEATH